MCFPLGCLKAYTGLGAVFSIIVALGLLGVSIYASLQKKSVVDKSSESIVNHALIGLYVGSITFVLLGAAGLYASCMNLRKNGQSGKAKCLMFLYSIGVLIFLILFLCLSIFFLVGPHLIFGTSCTAGSKLKFIEDLSNTYDAANKQFCTNNCPCYVTPGSPLKAYLVNLNYNVTVDATKAVRYQDCDSYDPTQYDGQAATLSILEEVLGCGGWCNTDNRFARFSNITACTSLDCLQNSEPCYNRFQQFMNGKSMLLGLSCLIATGLTFMNFIAVICICCHPTKKGQKNFYKRMLDTN